MRQQHFEVLDVELEASTGDELVAFAVDSGAAPHVEDAFLAEFTRFARARNHDEHAANELARIALDAIEDIDGTWQALRIEAWLAATAQACIAIEDAELCLLARAFVDWLADGGRLSLHGQRVLARRIARFHRHAEHALAHDLAA